MSRISILGDFRSRFVSVGRGLRLLLLPPRGRNPACRSRTDGVKIAQSCDRFSLHRDELARGSPVQSIVCIGICREQHHWASCSIVVPDRSMGTIAALSNSDSRYEFSTTARGILSITVEISYRAVRNVGLWPRNYWFRIRKYKITGICNRRCTICRYFSLIVAHNYINKQETTNVW